MRSLQRLIITITFVLAGSLEPSALFLQAQGVEGKSSLAQKVQRLRSTHRDRSEATSSVQEIGNPTYKRMLQSVVLIEWTVDDTTSRGTGWIIDAGQRLVVTNHHVIEGMLDCSVYFPEFIDGKLNTDPQTSLDPARGLLARVVDSDQTMDLALLQIEDPLPSDVLALELAERSASPGQRIHSIAGSTVGSQSLWIYSTGHVRQIVRGTLANEYEAMLLESDMATNQGNSGGPVCDDEGHVVAVVEGHRNDARLVSIYVDLQSLVEYLDAALQCVDPQTAEQLAFSADRHLSEGRPSIALQLATRATKLDPDSAELLTLRGWCRFDLDDDHSAQADFEDALRIHRTFAEAHEGLGHVFWSRGELEQAKTHFTNAIRNDAESAEYLIARGAIHRQLADHPAALRDFEAALSLDSENVDAQRGLAFAEIDLGHNERGLGRIDQIIEHFLDDAETFYYAGWAMRYLERYEEAVDVLGASLRLDPENANVHNTLCESLIELQRFEEALEPATVARNAFPQDANVACRYGLVLIANGDFENGLAEVRRATELAPNDANIRASYDYLLKNRTSQNNTSASNVSGPMSVSPVSTSTPAPQAFVGHWVANVRHGEGSAELRLTLLSNHQYSSRVTERAHNGQQDVTVDNGNFQVVGDELHYHSSDHNNTQVHRVRWQGRNLGLYSDELGGWIVFSRQ